MTGHTLLLGAILTGFALSGCSRCENCDDPQPAPISRFVPEGCVQLGDGEVACRAQSWDQSNLLELSDTTCPAQYDAPNGVLRQCIPNH